jgi:sterol desaturase/sphingolipid hydroxylase (fatty acid hydroxylase superfamily)
MYVLICFLFFIFLTFVGYIAHLILHQNWAGRFNSSHLNHHFVQYPADNFLSDKYRSAGMDSSFYVFAIIFSPIVFALLYLTIFHKIDLVLGLLLLFELGLFGFVNDNLHDAFHLNNSFWHQFWFFKKLKELHFVHHQNMDKNYGIFAFGWDQIFGTFREKENRKEI